MDAKQQLESLGRQMVFHLEKKKRKNATTFHINKNPSQATAQTLPSKDGKA
jgi:hypothetical protein